MIEKLIKKTHFCRGAVPHYSISGKKIKMSNVYIEPQPTGRPEGSAITHYTVEHAHGQSIDGKNYPTQQSAIDAAKAKGYKPLTARVRNTSKGNPDHWRSV